MSRPNSRRKVAHITQGGCCLPPSFIHVFDLLRCLVGLAGLVELRFQSLKPCRLAGARGVWLQQFLSEHEVRSHRSEVRFWRHDTRCFRSDSGDAPWLASGLVAFRYSRINPSDRSRFPWCVALQSIQRCENCDLRDQSSLLNGRFWHILPGKEHTPSCSLRFGPR